MSKWTGVTPNHLEVLLHYYTSPSDHPRKFAGAVAQAEQDWIDYGVLGRCPTRQNGYVVTPYGEAWLKAFLRTPPPKQVFVDSHGEVIE